MTRQAMATVLVLCLVLTACGTAATATPGVPSGNATPVTTVLATATPGVVPTVSGATVGAPVSPLATPSRVATVAGTGAVTRTEVIDYQPSVPAESESGSCFTTSLTVTRPGAYRCTVGNEIFDPCFVAPDGSTVVCGANPVTGSAGFVLQLTETLPTPEPPLPEATGPAAWLIVFADGAYCNFATGATGGVNGERISYVCSDQTAVIGDIDTSGPVWMALCGHVGQDASGQFGSSDAAEAAIERAWR